MNTKLEARQTDITKLVVDAIVNAANNSLLGGGGVDGAIHRAAGPELLAECRKLGGCATGDAKATGGYRLSAKHVVHTVGPVWYGETEDLEIGSREEDGLLASCYNKSLALARELGTTSIAFPAISTGVYGFPRERAASIAIREVRNYVLANEQPKHIIFCCFDRETLSIYEDLLSKL
jgi:O-acetyl-ADP-ribose deacetylase